MDNDNTDYKKVLQQEREVQLYRDILLSREDKITLIRNIELRQAERRRQIKRIRGIATASIGARHAITQVIIDLMRQQKNRLETLKQMI